MSETNQSLEEFLFEAALTKPSDAERATFLDGVCRDNPGLRARLEVLLEGHFQAKGFLSGGTKKVEEKAARPPTEPTDQAGQRIGRYKLLQPIGEGGCGIVYMAEQEEPVRRRVALKVVKLGMDTRQVIARFEAERQALALMDHPHIAKVLDAGATETGRPYFVMELVKGIPITRYCDENTLTTEQRLHLFIQVCQAIQHAHQKGIIHRDLKPSNILVADHDGTPVPKVIDFGIAKATTDQRLTDKTLFTAFEQFIGTPAYMSPEQAKLSGLDVDTRSDIYSLGVLLYELLTGKTPFEAKRLLEAGLDEIRRTIQEQEPVRPSTRLGAMTKEELTTTARHRGAEPPRLVSLVRGDLDWIVMKCLEKDRARRYETANGLARDLERHLNNEPVVARPPSRLYEFQKTVRRHWVGFTAVGAVLAALAIGTVISTLEAVRATRAEREQSRMRTRAETNEQKAQTEAARSAQVAQFMKGMLKGVGPGVARGRDTKLLREILDKTAERVGKELTNQPAVEADLRATLGNVYFDLGDFTNAAAMHQRALDIRKQLHGYEHPDVASSLNDLAQVLQWECRLDEAEAMHRDALAMRRKLLGPSNLDVAQSLSNLGWTLFFEFGNNPARSKTALAEAEPLLREALAIQGKALGNESVEVARTLNWLSLVLGQNKPAEAEMLAREGLNIYRKQYGDEYPAMSNLFDALGGALEHQIRPAAAEAAYRQAMVVRRKYLGDKHPEMRYSFVHLGVLFWNQGRLQEAEAMFRQLAACDENQQLYGEGFEALSVKGLASVLCDQGKLEDAKSVLHDGAKNGRARTLNEVAWLWASSPDEEIRDPPAAVACAEKAVAATGRTNALYLNTLAASYAACGQFTNAVRLQHEAIALLQDKDQRIDFAYRLRLFEAGRPCRDDDELASKAHSQLLKGKFFEAEKLLHECLTLRQMRIPDDWRTFNTRSMLGGALLGQKKYADAEPLLISGYEGMKEREAAIPRVRKVHLKEAVERLQQLYEATGQPDEAGRWQQKLAEFDKAQIATAPK